MKVRTQLETEFDIVEIFGHVYKFAKLWQTNTFAAFPTNPNTGEEATGGVETSQLYDQVINQTDTYYHQQFYHSATASQAAADFLDVIETTLLSEGESLRYDKSLYLAIRENI